MNITLTKDLIEAGRTGNGGYRRKQLIALGIGWPVKKGWLQGAIGMQVPEEQYQRFLEHSTNIQAQKIIAGEQPPEGQLFTKRAERLAEAHLVDEELDRSMLYQSPFNQEQDN